MTGAPLDALRSVPLFADLDDDELGRVASAFKDRRFGDGETVIQQGSGAAAFFVIESGAARVLVDGEERRTLGPGAHFGEMALLDSGARTATVIASGALVCSGVTFWDFQPLVEENGVIGWKLLQSLIRIYRADREAAAAPGS
jgi:CRP/FNR family cyclic AMP-dependent transcriptional regulator